MAGHERITDAGQHIGYWVSNSHIYLPARLSHPGNLAGAGQCTKADTAQAELAHIGAGPATPEASVMLLHLIFRRAL